MKLSEHLEELRKRLKVILLSLFVIVLVVFLLPLKPSQLLTLSGTIYYTTPVSVFLNAVVHGTLPKGWALIPFTVGAPLEILLLASLILAVAIDMPVIAYEVYRFVDPALKKEERSLLYPVTTSATALFVVGILFGYFILARFIFVAMAPFYSAVGLTQPYYISASDFYSIVFLCVLFCGVAFTTPVFVFLLIRFGVLSPSFFSKNRVLIWVATYIITAIVTPDGGPLLDVILFVPVITLLELSVFIGKRFAPKAGEKSRRRCKQCGEEVKEGLLFCPHCGRSLG
jgi:sec-independent protein translocase protein TatC